jgi:protocatechuate 3,4-dioxygenase beta subunit
MKYKFIFTFMILSVISSCNYSQQNNLSDCEWCGATEVSPDDLSWETTIANEEEEGERLIITGTVHKSDGKSSAEGVVLYMYHTNSKGVYPKKGNETGNGKRHGYLRGWVKTNENGEYKISTIKPASYPSRTDPAHIHVTIKEPDKEEYWIESFHFEDDPLLTDKIKNRFSGKGGSGIVKLEMKDGTWYAKRNIILEK